MDSDNHLIEIKINSYDELVNLICGKDEKNKHDLREDYVFRGLSNIEYELIPLLKEYVSGKIVPSLLYKISFPLTFF